ncbi:opioid-binding protein/cell adhesion molecule [Plakobranchus ocellatus]|uniref:Opioid-binding protein/cell adhesion molecule n=1 Tax=Plakobranchus ocellatus TaxID=259542 RepID=A0AAV4D1B2_9GAST|nr:opioid-binding protein/cell adhesion molecule [Plakobranchus ocellatus]
MVFTKEDRVIDETPLTIHVVTGQTASLPCTVDPRYTEQYADQYKVIWVNPVDTAISIQDRRILNDMRISVERPFLRDWNLHIRNVSLTDAGIYRCQINTRPVGTKRVELVVHEPPTIIDHTKPSDIERPEGETVELFCNASGTPPPLITWYRLNKNNDKGRELVGQAGEVLMIRNISRICADTYECVADNKVPPAISHHFKITIQYAPEINLPNSRLGQYMGKDTILECEVKAFPLGTVKWRHRGRTLANTLTHELNLYNKLDDSIILSLRLQQIKAEDFGEYECYADNELGITTKKMTLYEIPSKRSSSTTTTTTPAPMKWGNSRDRHNQGETSRANRYQHLNGDLDNNVEYGGKNSGLVRDNQKTDQYRPNRVDAQDGALRSNEGRNYGPSDSGSKYTGVISNDRKSENGSPGMNSVLLMTAMCICVAMAIGVVS